MKTSNTLIIQLSKLNNDVSWLELIEYHVACDDVQSELVELDGAPTEARFDRVLEIDGVYNAWTAHRAVELHGHPYRNPLAEVAP